MSVCVRVCVYLNDFERCRVETFRLFHDFAGDSLVDLLPDKRNAHHHILYL